MTVEAVTPENLTWENIKNWSGKDMKRHMAVPEMREAIKKVVATRQYQEVQELAIKQEQSEEQSTEVPVKTPEELLIEAEQQRVAQEQQRLLAEAERARLEAEELAKKKIVVEYQATDERGNPIGRPTHLEAYSQEEIIEKMKTAHIQATRAFHRLKEQKVQSIKDVNVAPPAPVQMTDADLLAAVKDLKSDDPKIVLDAHRRLNAAEIAKATAEANTKAAEEKELRRQEKVSFDFLKAHQDDFNNCQANVKIIADFLQENELAWTFDNLEIAFHAKENELAPVAAPVVAPLPANPAPVVQPSATIAAAPVVQPTPTATAPVVPPVNPAPVQPRPGVNGGIVPGDNSAPRPASSKKGLTIEEILSWDGATMRAKMRSPLRDEIIRVTNEARLTRGR